MTSLINVSYQGRSQTIAIYEGLKPDELSNVLQAVFGFSGNAVGILAEVRIIEHDVVLFTYLSGFL